MNESYLHSQSIAARLSRDLSNNLVTEYISHGAEGEIKKISDDGCQRLRICQKTVYNWLRSEANDKYRSEYIRMHSNLSMRQPVWVVVPVAEASEEPVSIETKDCIPSLIYNRNDSLIMISLLMGKNQSTDSHSTSKSLEPSTPCKIEDVSLALSLPC